jgi:hypothetical protein
VSCSVHDVAALEDQGLPCVFVATEEFRSAREAQAAALGSDPAVVWLPHPIQDRTDGEMRELADSTADAVLAALLVP